MFDIFPNYATPPLPDDDTELPKWRAVRRADAVNIAMTLDVEDISRTNISVNRFVRFVAEAPGVSNWQLPSCTLEKASGDCKDYAILKYSLLRNSGIPESDMMIVCGDLTIGLMKKDPQHAFLAAKIDGAWKVLDSKFDQLIAPKDYLNFIPIKGFSGNNGVLFSRQFTIAERMAEHDRGIQS